MNSSDISIAVVTRVSRPARFLERVLDGLLLQSGPSIRWSIVTHLSLTDAHLACLERARKHNIEIDIMPVEKGLSLGHLANIGVIATESEFVILHDDDDALRCNFFGPAMKLFQTGSYVAVACHAAIIIESQKRKRLDFVLSPGRVEVKRHDIMSDNKFVTNGIIFTRLAYNKANGYPEDVPVAEDWLFYLELLKNGDVRVFAKVCANVFIRQTDATHSDLQNTNKQQHEMMRDKIRETLKVHPESLKVKKWQAMRYKIMRHLDQIVFKFIGGFLPRV